MRFLTRPGPLVLLPAVVVLFLTDYFDGIIARTQDRETTFGKWADPLADKLLLLIIVDRLVAVAPEFWLEMFLLLLWPEISLIAAGVALKRAGASVMPRPVIWGRVKFALDFLGVVTFLAGWPAVSKRRLVAGVVLAYMAFAAYFLRGVSELSPGRSSN